ncbi:DUF2892 domain-containing protein [Mobilitalea sibirica]|uniref:DUF2892 domain-containing protein n=1 Tax=Mobilitalea sibirica TaxID=1462919 RepID=A0A8J7H3V7_9FIRM|nr:DUF2892 domain-containing protein [Mobilitalea sibirica]MBH1941775.1 DUF2892 domain-containing protein [Mobilitalea sibirica]
MNKKRTILPPTALRVFLRTDPLINAEIRNQTIRNLNIYKNCNEDEIADRIRYLNLEWDTERVLEANAATLIILSSILGIKTSRCWFLLTGLIGMFVLQHALQGWCPPVPLVRKWGVRTAEEISAEKTALKMLRGDFAKDTKDAVELLKIADKM